MAFIGAGLALALWFFCGSYIAAEAVYPVENGANWISRHVGSRIKSLFAGSSAFSENERLRKEVACLRMACAEFARVTDENKRLRGMLGLDGPGDSVPFSTNRWICARVLSRGAAAGNPCVLRLGRGSLAGVKRGAVVAVPEGLVGRIANVTPNTSELRLITDPSTRVACEVELGGEPGAHDGAQPSRLAHGILYGRGHSPVASTETSILYIVHPLRVRNVERQTVLPQRAKIITSGLGGVFPRGLTVGFLIDGAHGDETNLEQEGDVEPAVDFLSLENVFIRRED